LSDEEKRPVYDRFGEEGLQNGASAHGHGGFDPFDIFSQYVVVFYMFLADLFIQVHGRWWLPSARY
jgi:DnaJ-class molecular chaperone